MASFSSTPFQRSSATVAARLTSAATSLSQTPVRATASAQMLSGPSLAMTQLWSRLQRVAPYFRTAMLTGEVGTGQEAVARALHELSPLGARPFAVFSGSLAEAKLTSEPARKAAAALGTIYLPSPETLSPAAQHGLLVLLRERSSTAPRMIAYAEHGLRPLVSSGLASALANSLGALPIELPNLRERGEDLPLLVGYLLRRQAEKLHTETPLLAADFFAVAREQPWSGNLNQLESALHWLLTYKTQKMLHGADLLAALAALSPAPAAPPAPAARLVRLDQIVREQVQSVLSACNGNKLRAAEILGISRSTLYRMLSSGETDWTPGRQ